MFSRAALRSLHRFRGAQSRWMSGPARPHNLEAVGITTPQTIHHNLSYPELFEHEKKNNEGTVMKAEYGETFAVDTKLRAKVAAANAAFMSNTFGDAGAEAAAAEAGPSDLADRSGAMTKAAGDNFGAGEVDASAADAQRIADGEGATWKPNL